MMTIEHDRDDYLVCRIAGKLTKDDYDAAIPELENALRLRPDNVRMMIVLEDFRGWESGALWEDLKLNFKYRDEFGRIAVLGQSAVEEWGTRLSKPFFGADIKFFDIGDRGMAHSWLSTPSVKG